MLPIFFRVVVFDASGAQRAFFQVGIVTEDPPGVFFRCFIGLGGVRVVWRIVLSLRVALLAIFPGITAGVVTGLVLGWLARVALRAGILGLV